MPASPSTTQQLLAAATVAAGTALLLHHNILSVPDGLCRHFMDPQALASRRRRQLTSRTKGRTSQRIPKTADNNKDATIRINNKDLDDWTEQNILSSTTKSTSISILHMEQDAIDESYHLRISLSSQQQNLVPLIPFCRILEQAWKRTIHTYTFLFIADACGGDAAPSITRQVLSGNDTTTTTPHWIIQWSQMAHEASLGSTQSASMVLSTLLRFWQTTLHNDAKTVPLLIPTDLIPVLWPALYKAFPHDRFAFLYTGAMEFASAQQQPCFHIDTNNSIQQQQLARSWHIPSLPKLYQALATLSSGRIACTVESWMAAVDTLIHMQENETETFLPFVCKIDELRDNEQQQGSTPPSTSYWARRALFQYMTGNRGADTPVPSVHVSPPSFPTQLRDQTALQAAVFCHKRILIAHKTLPDTVAPIEHWGLKQAMKNGGCACCGPEDDEEDENDEIPPTEPSGFVDGKLGFAFDPTKFA